MPVKDFWTSRGSKVNLNNRHISSKWSFSKHPKTGLKLRELSASNSIWHIWPSSCIVKHRNLYRLHGSKRSIVTISNRSNHLELTLLTLPGTARHCQVLPGTARMWRCCGAKVATKLPVPVRIPSFRAMASWQPGDSNQNEARLSRFVLSLVFYGFVMFCRFISRKWSAKNEERIGTSTIIYAHLSSSSSIFHHLPSSSKSTWISHD